MTHVFDKDLMVLENATVTQDVSSTALLVYGGIRAGLAARVVVADAYASDDTMQPRVYISEDGTTYQLVSTGPSKTVKGGAEFIVPFPVKPGKNYVKIELVVTATTKNYTGVYAGIVPNPGFEYTRKTNWS
jgi:hypothetical protein